MLNTLFRFLLTFNATFLLVIIFLVQSSINLDKIFLYWWGFNFLPNHSNYISYAVYMVFLLSLTRLSIWLSSKLGEDNFNSGEVIRVEYANNSFLPSYLGYFFVALSIQSWETLGFVYTLLFVFTFFSQALYFNPLFLVFGYNFYDITTKNGIVLFLISREEFKAPESINISANRINDYTFIDGGK